MNFQFDSVQDQAQVQKLFPRLADPKIITAAATSFTTGASPATLFTVDGDCLVRLFASVQTALASTSSTGTLAIGVTGNTGLFFAATTMDGTNFPIGAAWAGDTSPTLKGELLSATALNWAMVAAGADIIATVATNSATAGAITFYCQYVPLSRDARIIPA